MSGKIGLCAAGALLAAAAAWPAGAVTFLGTIDARNLAAMAPKAPAPTIAPRGDFESLVDDAADGMVAADDRMGWLHDVDGGDVLSGFMPKVGLPGATAALPEPQAWALMLMGFGAAGGLLRGRRRAQLPTG